MFISTGEISPALSSEEANRYSPDQTSYRAGLSKLHELPLVNFLDLCNSLPDFSRPVQQQRSLTQLKCEHTSFSPHFLALQFTRLLSTCQSIISFLLLSCSRPPPASSSSSSPSPRPRPRSSPSASSQMTGGVKSSACLATFSRSFPSLRLCPSWGWSSGPRALSIYHCRCASTTCSTRAPGGRSPSSRTTSMWG